MTTRPGTDPCGVGDSEFCGSGLLPILNIIGKGLTVERHRCTVIGVAPRRNSDGMLRVCARFWVPMSAHREIKPAQADLLEARGSHWLMAVARLRPKLLGQQAQSSHCWQSRLR